MGTGYWLAVILALLACMSSVRAEVPKVLRVCGDINEFPPFTYAVRDAARQLTTVAGYNVDYLERILQASGRRATYSLLPWKRCIALAANGHFDLVLDVVKAAERERYFMFPPVLYTLTPIAIFSSARPVPELNDPKDLNAWKVCAPLGWDFTLAGITTPESSSHPTSLEAALAMLRIGRCDALLFEREVVDGFRQRDGSNPISEREFTFKPLRWRSKSEFYVVVSRALPYRDELLTLLDRGIAEQKKSGAAQRLLRKHLLKDGGPAPGTQ